MKQPLARISTYTLTNALGNGNAQVLSSLLERKTGLQPCDFDIADLDTWIGRVKDVENIILPTSLTSFTCRNNQLAQLALEQDGFLEAVTRCRQTYDPARIGLFLGTSTSGIHQTELAYRARGAETSPLADDYVFEHTHLINSLAEYVGHVLGLKGPALTVSTACSSSAKVFACAHRYMQLGLCDAAIVGGVDSLCLTTLYGFNALQLVSPDPCRPWDRNRTGINIGEGAGFVLLERAESDDEGIMLLGYGESGDAHHIASPHPEGTGAALAVNRALEMAGLEPQDIDYINLHGTATRANDASESAALEQVFAGKAPPFSSTKGWTGHTLGAAGVTEAIICCQAIEHEFIPGTLNTTEQDPDLSPNLQLDNRDISAQRMLSNSFGFGGSNCSLILGHSHP